MNSYFDYNAGSDTEELMFLVGKLEALQVLWIRMKILTSTEKLALQS